VKAAQNSSDWKWINSADRRGEGLPILGGSPFLEETDERIYDGGKDFRCFATESRCLVERAQPVWHFQGAPGNREGRSAFRYVIPVRRE
jgi:hypothetical protein